MTLKDFVVLIAGGAAIIIGCIGKEFDFGGLSGVAVSKQRVPTAYGRVMFISMGCLFLLFELKHLLLGNR